MIRVLKELFPRNAIPLDLEDEQDICTLAEARATISLLACRPAAADSRAAQL